MRWTLHQSMRALRRRWPAASQTVCWNAGAARFPLPSWVEQREAAWADRPVRAATSPMLWKWAPPRLAPGAWEVALDADLWVRDAGFLSGCLDGRPWLSAGWARRYGAWDAVVPAGVTACAGLVVLPPGWDFAAALRATWDAARLPLDADHDEQGWVTATLAGAGCAVLPMTTVTIVHPTAALNRHWGTLEAAAAAAAWHLVDLRRAGARHCGFQACRLKPASSSS